MSSAAGAFSIVNLDGEPEERLEWEEGTLFSPPVFAWHQHFNLSDQEPARYLAIQDTRLKRHLRMHQIERHAVQLSREELIAGAECVRRVADLARRTHEARHTRRHAPGLIPSSGNEVARHERRDRPRRVRHRGR